MASEKQQRLRPTPGYQTDQEAIKSRSSPLDDTTPERIKQRLENKRAHGEKVGGTGRDQKKREKVADLLKRGSLTMGEIAKLAGVGIATVYRIKRELSQPA